MSYSYFAFGLCICSDLELPECVSSPPGAGLTPDVEISLGPVPEALKGGRKVFSYMEVGSNQCLLSIPDTARYLIEGGNRIHIQLAPNAQDYAVRAYLLGSAIGTILHQRRLLPIHMSAVATPRGIVGFAGPSGGGKSTIAAALHVKEGSTILTDDLAIVEPSGTNLRLLTGIRRLRLWLDAVAELNLEGRDKSRVVARANKFQFDMVETKSEHRELQLRALVLLNKGQRHSIERLTGVEAFSALRSAIYRPDLAEFFNDNATVFRHLSLIAQRVSVYRLTRPFTEGSLAASVRQVKHHVYRKEFY
ncbi:MAG: hypothetical protein AAF498_01870 [Pseudomonadota bacterium]